MSLPTLASWGFLSHYFPRRGYLKITQSAKLVLAQNGKRGHWHHLIHLGGGDPLASPLVL